MSWLSLCQKLEFWPYRTFHYFGICFYVFKIAFPQNGKFQRLLRQKCYNISFWQAELFLYSQTKHFSWVQFDIDVCLPELLQCLLGVVVYLLQGFVFLMVPISNPKLYFPLCNSYAALLCIMGFSWKKVETFQQNWKCHVLRFVSLEMTHLIEKLF